MRRALGLAFALLLVPSCAARKERSTTDENPTSRSQAIAGGEASTERAVVSVERIDGGAFDLCSGTLIAPNLVLTAAHCLRAGPRVGSCEELSLGPVIPPEDLRVSTVDDLTKSPDETWRFAAGAESFFLREEGSVCGADLGLLLLEEPLAVGEIAPLSIALDSPSAGQSVIALGYGAGHQSGAGERRRRQSSPLEIVCVEDGCAFLLAEGWAGAPALASPEVTSHEFMSEKGPCPGDSGGPALRDSQVVGVLSRGYEDCTGPVFTMDFEGVRELVRQLAMAGKIELPEWAAAPATRTPATEAPAEGGAGGAVLEEAPAVPGGAGGEHTQGDRDVTASERSGCAWTPRHSTRLGGAVRNGSRPWGGLPWVALLCIAPWLPVVRRRKPR